METFLSILDKYGPYVAVTLLYIWIQYEQNKRCEQRNANLVAMLGKLTERATVAIERNTGALEDHADVQRDTLRFLHDRFVSGVEEPREPPAHKPTKYRSPRPRPSLPETDRLPSSGD